jgi:AcrR family transcriptional regulator
VVKNERSYYFLFVMTTAKGAQTREAILEHAIRLASEVGLEGLTIGRLAAELDLSKSGLFAHFASKEGLQVETLERAAEQFVEVVVRPALAAPRGIPRLRALFERWLRWPREVPQPGGCIFVQAAVELDDRPGPARDRLVALQREFLATIATAARSAVANGQLAGDTDPEQFAFELYGIMLSTHHASRLLEDPKATQRARRAFERLLGSADAAT